MDRTTLAHLLMFVSAVALGLFVWRRIYYSRERALRRQQTKEAVERQKTFDPRD